MYGYAQIPRSEILDTGEKYTKREAYIDLYIIANHKDGYIQNRNGIMKKIERGQVGWGIKGLGKRRKWSEKKVRNFIDFLKKEGKIDEQKIQGETSIIIVIGYIKDEQKEVQSDEQKEVQSDEQKQSKGRTNNNDNNANNENNEKNDNYLEFGEKFKFKIEEKKYNSLLGIYSKSDVIDKIETLENYCLSKGKKYKDYGATLHNFLKRDCKPKPKSFYQDI